MNNAQLHDLARVGAQARLATLDTEREQLLNMFPDLRGSKPLDEQLRTTCGSQAQRDVACGPQSTGRAEACLLGREASRPGRCCRRRCSIEGRFADGQETDDP